MTRQRPRPCIGNGMRPCPHHGLATIGSRCRQCRSQYNIALGSSAQRGYGGQWRILREIVLERDLFTCHWCGRPAGSVDHIILKARGGSDDPSNLVAACGRCNSTRNQNSEPAGAPANSAAGQQTTGPSSKSNERATKSNARAKGMVF